ncbi:hypothetical protein BKA80DRAFT_125656 [Phyllosticta citrichinensis]
MRVGLNPPIEAQRPRRKNKKGEKVVKDNFVGGHSAAVDARYTMQAALAIISQDLAAEEMAGRPRRPLPSPPIFMSVDTESYEHNHDRLTEVGVTILDLNKVKDRRRGPLFKEWFDGSPALWDRGMGIRTWRTLQTRGAAGPGSRTSAERRALDPGSRR